MSPALVHLHNLEPEPSTTFLAHGTKFMHDHSKLHPRSNDNGSIGGVQDDTVIFIIVGVVCLLVILTGFYLVSRRAKCNAARGPRSRSQHSPTTHSPCPRTERNMSQYWKIWRTWRHTSDAGPPPVVTAEVLTVQASPPPDIPSPTIPPAVLAYPLIVPRPSQGRRVTSLSVTTSFSHSHITQDVLNDFRLSAYDLDGDLETEMLNSARDDFWPGHPFGIEVGCGEMGIEETMEDCGDATRVVNGSVQGHASTQRRSDDYENSGAFQDMRPGGKGDERNVVKIVETGEVAMGLNMLS